MSKPTLELWGDGAVKANGKPEAVAGWGALIKLGDTTIREWNGHLPAPKYPPYQSNNTGELMAIISGLEALERPYSLSVFSDSAYVINGMTEQWYKNWERNGWKNANGEPVKNKRLWKRLVEVASPHDIKWVHIRGHVGIDDNERCDELAKMGVNQELVDNLMQPLSVSLSEAPTYVPVSYDLDSPDDVDF